MATGSPEVWHGAPNATSAHYQAAAQRIGMGLPISASDGREIARVQRRGEPRRKANHLWGEFNVIPAPAQTGAIATQIHLGGKCGLPGLVETRSRYRRLPNIGIYKRKKSGDMPRTSK